MSNPPFRIVSLLPSATEIVAALGLADCLVGRSHECDYPPQVQSLPVCTAPKINPEGTSLEIHDRVTNLLESALSVYQIKTEVLQELQPTHIITQDQCDVCAVTFADVEQAAAQLLGNCPQIISLKPNLLDEVWASIQQVASAFDVNSKPLIDSLLARIGNCANQTLPLCPMVACIEWIEPLMAAGNWVPELVKYAGGTCIFGKIGQHSPWLKWEDLVSADPQIIIFMPCGFDLERTRQEVYPMMSRPQWQQLQAVKTGKVYITDGNAYFNRPGPRLVDSLEILAEIFHPERFNFGYEGRGWERIKVMSNQ